jgi:hypothetical protein
MRDSCLSVADSPGAGAGAGAMTDSSSGAGAITSPPSGAGSSGCPGSTGRGVSSTGAAGSSAGVSSASGAAGSSAGDVGVSPASGATAVATAGGSGGGVGVSVSSAYAVPARTRQALSTVAANNVRRDMLNLLEICHPSYLQAQLLATAACSLHPTTSEQAKKFPRPGSPAPASRPLERKHPASA